MLLRGVCTALVVCVWVASAQAASSMNPNPLDVGNVVLGNTGQRQGTLSSDSNDRVDLLISNCTGAMGNFTFSDDNNLDLKNNVVVTLSYQPITAGVRQCTVLIVDQMNAMEVKGMFTIRGNGQTPSTMSVSMAAVDFGSARFNNAAPDTVDRTTRTIQVSNTGDVSFTLNSVTASPNPDFTVTNGPALPNIILPGNVRTFTITFNPDAAGGRAGSVQFSSDAAINPSQTVTTSGVGTNAVIAVSDPSFGVVNIGSTAAAEVIVSNVGAATKGPLGVTTISISGGGGWFTFNGCGNGTTCTPAIPLSINTMQPVGVRCSPPITAGLNESQTAMVTFTSDTDDATDTVSTVTCTAGQSSLATSMGAFTFPSQLVGTTSAPLMMTVENHGNVVATFYFLKTGLQQGMFAITSPNGCGLTGTTNQCSIPAKVGATAGTITFSMTYTPIIEGDVASGVTLISNANLDPQLAAAGRGIDRHISVTDAIQANDTFRNPGSTATVVPIVIENVGEYPLHVSEFVLNSSAPDIWTLEAPFAPFDVPGLDTKTVNLLFAPQIAGKAPDGAVALTSDDRVSPMKIIRLTGNGKDRNVEMTPGNIDFGNTGAGVPVRLSAIKTQDQLLTLINMDDAMFKIRKFEFDNPDDGLGPAFEVQDSSGNTISNRDLPAGETQRFDIVFAPPKVGSYSRQLTLYLDEDPLGQRTILVQGNALFVDAQGGGGFGCSTGSGAGAGVLLGLLALRRRRRA